ncbi:cyanoglobin [Aquiflexum sp.]|uniref:globin domain-containing protein n=1 Tax=Aquiflexum sp. TaxID=1872584 RepID=UPI0035938913
MTNPVLSNYQSLGEEKIKTLVSHFYQNVRKSPELLKLYPSDLAPAEERLFLFLVQVFGGPQTYMEKRGHPILRKRHFQWPIDSQMRNTGLNCMIKAIDSVEMDPNIKEEILSYFVKAANHMVNK